MKPPATGPRKLIRNLATALHNESADEIKAAMEELLVNKSAELRMALQVHVDEEDETLLHIAGREANADLLRRLIDMGADVLAADSDGDTALPGTLNAAAWKNTDEAALVLIEAGAPVNAKDRFGLTPLHHAAGCSGAEVVGALIERGAYLEATSDPQLRQGAHRPLHEACVYGNIEAVQLLLDAGSQIDAQSADGATALSTAVQFGHPRIAVLLVGAGAGIDLPDSRLRTPLHHAAWLGENEILAELLAAGANPDEADEIGRTPREILSAFEDSAFFGEIIELADRGPVNLDDEQQLVIYFDMLLSNKAGLATYERGSFLAMLNKRHRWLNARCRRLTDSLVGISRNRTYSGAMPRILARIGFDLFQNLSLAYHSARNPEDGYNIIYPDMDRLYDHFEDVQQGFWRFFSGNDGFPKDLTAQDLVELEMKTREFDP